MLDFDAECAIEVIGAAEGLAATVLKRDQLGAHAARQFEIVDRAANAG